MFGGAWYQKRNGSQIRVDQMDEPQINTIVFKYRNMISSNTGVIITQDLPSDRKLQFEMGNSTGHMNNLKNITYITKSGKYPLVEVDKTKTPITTHRFTADGQAFDTISGRRI
jgi:hypothetical protein